MAYLSQETAFTLSEQDKVTLPTSMGNHIPLEVAIGHVETFLIEENFGRFGIVSFS